MRYVLTILIVLLVAAGFALPCQAQPQAGDGLPPVLRLGTSKPPLDLGPYISVLEPGDKDLTPEEAASVSRAKDFKALQSDTLVRSYNQAAYWLCFRLHQEGGPHDGEWVLELGWTRLFSIHLFVAENGGPSDANRLREISPAKSQVFGRGWRHPSFRLNLEPGRTYTFYMQLRPYRYLLVHPRLSREASFFDSVSGRYLFYGFYYGLIMAMILYNLVAYFTLGDRNYLWYVIYVFFFTLYMLANNGLLNRVLPPLSHDAANQLDLMFFGLMFATAGQVVRMFLETRRYSPVVEKLLLAYIFGAIILVASTPFFSVEFLHRIYFWSFIGPGLAVWASIGALRRGFGPAGYFLAAWLVLGLGSAATALTFKGILPFNFFTANALQMSSAIEVGLLSLALAARIKKLNLERQSLAISERRYRKLSQTDELTGLYNKRYLMDWLQDQAVPSRLGLGFLSLIIMDVDDFKAFNDTYGHPAGDQVLMALAGVIEHNARQGDIACRYGGEEFVVILPGASARQAETVAERIRNGFGSQTFSPRPGAKVSVTVSLGVAQMNGDESVEELLERADRALYLAKDLGKNRSELAA